MDKRNQMENPFFDPDKPGSIFVGMDRYHQYSPHQPRNALTFIQKGDADSLFRKFLIDNIKEAECCPYIPDTELLRFDLANMRQVPPVDQDTIDFRINKGKNYKVFEVLPYIRIVNPDIRYKGNKVVAKFSLQQYTVDPVKTIALFAHTESHVSSNIQTAKVSSEINTAVSPLTEYELSMDLSQTTGIEREHSYFFRIGALSSTSEAKYNYSPAVEIDL